MPYGKGSEAEIKQRHQSARKHGAVAFEARGEASLDKPQRSRLQELKDNVQSREGTIDLMRNNAANAMMITELVLSYVSQQNRRGVGLEDIPSLRSLPAYMNTAQRALRDLVNLMPDDKEVLDARDVLESMKHGQKDD